MSLWTRMLNLLPWHRQPLPVSELDAALAANTRAHESVAAEEAWLTDQMSKQSRRTQEMLGEIRERAAKGQRPSSALVAIAHTLKSLERP